MTEKNQERRRRQANAVNIIASQQRMPLAEFEQHFKKPWFLANPTFRDIVEGNTQELFCDECMCDGIDGGVVAYIFHVTIEDDPLKNFWKLATMRCFGCGFSEIVPLEQPSFNAGDFNTIGAVQPGLMGSGMRGVPGQIMPVHDIWMQEYANQHAVYAQQQEVARQRAMAHAKAQLAQAKMQSIQEEFGEGAKLYERVQVRRELEQKPPSEFEKQSRIVDQLRKKLGL